MPGSLKDLVVKLGIDTSGFDGGVTGSIDKLGLLGNAATVALGAVVAGVTAISAAAFKVGHDWEEASNAIRSRTGETGAALESLRESAQNVFQNVPNSAREVAEAISEIRIRTGLTGAALEELTTQTLNLVDVTGGDLQGTIAATTRVFGDWSIATERQTAANDHMFRVTQQTGIGLEKLASTVVQFGAPLRQLGFSFEESTALIGKFEREGVNLETVMSGMRVGLANLARAGLDPAEAFRSIADGIKNAADTATANSIAIEVFGQRAGPDMAAAIREGRFEIDGLVEALAASTETINSADAASEGFGEKLDVLTNQVGMLLEPLGSSLVEALSNLVTQMQTAWSEIDAVVAGFKLWVAEIREVNPALDALMMIFGAVGSAIAYLVTNHIKVLIDGLGKLAEAASYVWSFFKAKGDKTMQDHAAATAKASAATSTLTAEVKKTGEESKKTAPSTKSLAEILAALGTNARKAKPEVFDLEKAINSAEKVTRELEKTAKDAAQALANELAADARIASLEVVKVGTDTEAAMLKIQGFTKTAADEWSALAAAASMRTGEIDQAFKDLGLNTITELNTMAKEAEARFQTIKNSGEATPKAIETAWLASLKAKKEALVASGTDLGTEEQKILDDLLAKQGEFKTASVGVFSEWAAGLKTTISGLSTDLVSGLFSGKFNVEGIGEKLRGIADSFRDVFVTKATEYLDGLIQKGINVLMGALDGVIEKLIGQGGVQAAMSTAFGGVSAAGGAAGSAGSAGGAAGSAGGAGGAGGAGSSAGGAMGMVNMITGIATAISSIFGNFQMARLETTMNAVEHNTRYSMMYLGERGDGGIIGQVFKTNELLSWGPGVKAVEVTRDYAVVTYNELVSLRAQTQEVIGWLRAIYEKETTIEMDGQEVARVVGANMEALAVTA